MATKGQKFKQYDPELKKQVVKEYLENNTPLLELAYKHQITSQESILQWVKNYQKYGDDAFVDKRGLATTTTAPFKGRPRVYFATKEEEEEYKALWRERNRQRSSNRRRLTKLKKKRTARKEMKKKYN